MSVESAPLRKYEIASFQPYYKGAVLLRRAETSYPFPMFFLQYLHATHFSEWRTSIMYFVTPTRRFRYFSPAYRPKVQQTRRLSRNNIRLVPSATWFLFKKSTAYNIKAIQQSASRNYPAHTWPSKSSTTSYIE